VSSGTTQKAQNYFNALQQFSQDFTKAIQTVVSFCDIIPGIPSLSFFLVNFPAYVAYIVTAPLRYPLCILLGGLEELECPQCILYNLFPFLSILDLFGPPSPGTCPLFGCICPQNPTGCGQCYQQNAGNFGGITSLFYCNGHHCPESWLNYVFCLLGYAFLSPFTPFIYLLNLGLSRFLGKEIYFSFNCRAPKNLPGNNGGGGQ
jgi:hypothetical protein